MEGLHKLIQDPKTRGMTFSDPTGKSYKMQHLDNFEYTDPIDGSVSKNQVGLYVPVDEFAFLTSPLYYPFCLEQKFS